MRSIGLAVLLLAVGGTHCLAETLTWTVRHQYPFTVNFALYSENRSHVWPSARRVWTLNNWRPFTIRISCLRYEKVCFGAWAFTGQGGQYRYWGVGPNRKHRCTTCCYSCNGGGTGEIVLRN